jgi:hypothetical protein
LICALLDDWISGLFRVRNRGGRHCDNVRQ